MRLIPNASAWIDQAAVPLLHRSMNYLEDCCIRSYQDVRAVVTKGFLVSPRTVVETVVSALGVVCWTVLAFVWWCILQFFSVWSYGEGFYPMEVTVYLGLAVWNIYDIVDLKLSNRALVIGSETSWGFGQILPMVVLLLVFFNMMDAFEEP